MPVSLDLSFINYLDNKKNLEASEGINSCEGISKAVEKDHSVDQKFSVYTAFLLPADYIKHDVFSLHKVSNFTTYLLGHLVLQGTRWWRKTKFLI